MLLIELFKDYIFNKKDLVEYVELRKSINERGEFNDALLIQAAKNLEHLKTEDTQVYQEMYETLNEYVKSNEGLSIEIPINFIRQILKLDKNGYSAKKMLEDYKNELKHYHHNV